MCNVVVALFWHGCCFICAVAFNFAFHIYTLACWVLVQFLLAIFFVSFEFLDCTVVRDALVVQVVVFLKFVSLCFLMRLAFVVLVGFHCFPGHFFWLAWFSLWLNFNALFVCLVLSARL